METRSMRKKEEEWMEVLEDAHKPTKTLSMEWTNRLQEACISGDKDSATLAVENGADIDGVFYGRNALKNCIVFGHNDLAALLIEKGADVHAWVGIYDPSSKFDPTTPLHWVSLIRLSYA